MSAYSYKQYRITATNGTETVSPSSSEFFGVISGKNTYKNEYYFKGYGQILGSDTVRAYGEINRAIALEKKQTPAIFNWEIGSGAYVETQLWDDTTNKHYVAFSRLLEYTIEYNGAIRQSNIAHEVRGKG